MPNDLPPLADFLDGPGPATYAGEPDVSRLPGRDRGTPGTTVGRMHTRPPTILNIVNSEGVGFPMDLSQVTQDKMAEAAVPQTAYANSTDAAVATYHRLASGQSRPASTSRNPAYTGSVVAQLAQPAAPGLSTRRRAIQVGQPEPAPVSAPEPQRGPAAPGYVEQGVRQTRPNLMAPPQMLDRVDPPAQQVTYEVPGYGPLDNFYHQVIRTGDHLVLVYDKRYVGQRGFPRHSDSQLGMRVHGTDNLFVVQTTGIEFELDSKSLCLLSIVSEGSYNEYLEQNDPLARSMNTVPFLPEHASGEVRQYPTGGDAPGDSSHDETPGF